MKRSLRHVAWLALVPMSIAASLACACSTSDPTLAPTQGDPSTPGLDAPWNPTPDKPGATTTTTDNNGSSTSASSSGSSGSSGPATTSSSGVTTTDKDAGGETDALTPLVTSTPLPAQGEVLITEVMYDPFGTEPDGEWFEVYSTAKSTRSLSGLTIVDGSSRTHTIAAGVTIDPDTYVVLARLKSVAITAKVPAAAIVYEYGTGLPSNGGIQLTNGTAGGVWLRDGTTQIAQAAYGGWYSQSGGSSVQLKTLTYADSANSASWCLSFTQWTTGSNKGTPGAASDCP